LKIIVLLFLPLNLFANWIGNPADPALLDEGFWIPDTSCSSARLGMSGDCLLSKRLKASPESSKLGISRPEMNWQLMACDMGWNVKERLDLHVLVGPLAKLNLSWFQKGVFYEALGSRGVYWGSSSKLVLLDVQDTVLGVDARIGGVQWIKGTLLANGALFRENSSMRLYFWQVGAGLSQNLGALKPYFGAVMQQLVTVMHTSGFKHVRLNNLILVGMYEGCSVSLGSRVFLNLEARQFFESGVSVSGEVRF
jgi:hypothetical protein